MITKKYFRQEIILLSIFGIISVLVAYSIPYFLLVQVILYIALPIILLIAHIKDTTFKTDPILSVFAWWTKSLLLTAIFFSSNNYPGKYEIALFAIACGFAFIITQIFKKKENNQVLASILSFVLMKSLISWHLFIIY